MDLLDLTCKWITNLSNTLANWFPLGFQPIQQISKAIMQPSTSNTHSHAINEDLNIDSSSGLKSSNIIEGKHEPIFNWKQLNQLRVKLLELKDKNQLHTKERVQIKHSLTISIQLIN